MENLLKWMRRYVSPVFLALLVASFILWYLAKLTYMYTTEQTIRLSIDGQPVEITCVVEGVGTNLFGYRVYMNKTLRIPLAELKTRRATTRASSSSTRSRCSTRFRYASATSRSSPSVRSPRSTTP